MSRARRLTISISLVASLLLLAMALPAVAQNAAYRVSGVEVSATAADAVQAQALAIEQGQREGLRQLLERLAGAGAAPSTAGLPMQDFVSSFEVLDESVGPTSYSGTLAITYDRDAVQELLDGQGIAFVREQQAPVLLVPLWDTGAGLKLWEADNAWKAAWDEALDTDAVATFVVPLGDLRDLALVDADQAIRADPAALRALAERYGTEEVVVARLIGSGTPGSPLQVQAQSYGTDAPAPYRAVVRLDGGSLQESLERAVREMQRAYDARARSRAVAASGPMAPLVVSTAVTGLESWGRLVQRLETMSGVEVRGVREFSRDSATLDLRVAGGAERLRPELERSGWFLRDDGAGGFRLEQGGAPIGQSAL